MKNKKSRWSDWLIIISLLLSTLALYEVLTHARHGGQKLSTLSAPRTLASRATTSRALSHRRGRSRRRPHPPLPPADLVQAASHRSEPPLPVPAFRTTGSDLSGAGGGSGPPSSSGFSSQLPFPVQSSPLPIPDGLAQHLDALRFLSAVINLNTAKLSPGLGIGVNPTSDTTVTAAVTSVVKRAGSTQSGFELGAWYHHGWAAGATLDVVNLLPKIGAGVEIGPLVLLGTVTIQAVPQLGLTTLVKF